MRALSHIVVAWAALLAGCCGPGFQEDRAGVTVEIEAQHVLSLALQRANDSDKVVRVPVEGGRVTLEPGAWFLKVLDSDSRESGLAVPAFGPPVEGPIRLLIPSTLEPGDDGFATIPAGPALIGDRLGVGKPDERPARIVDVAAFQLGRTEVTNAQYVEFLNTDRRTMSDEDLGTLLDVRSRKCRIERTDAGFETDAPDLPVVTVSWFGASAYCEWLTRVDGRSHRLPTEVEWEKAARGLASCVYSYGDVYTPTAANQESGTLMPVGQFERNSFGLFDMTGNAFEWTSDERPASHSHPRTRYLRGGSFVLDGIFLRNSFRMFLRPTVRADDVGFRVLREL